MADIVERINAELEFGSDRRTLLGDDELLRECKVEIERLRIRDAEHVENRAKMVSERDNLTNRLYEAKREGSRRGAEIERLRGTLQQVDDVLSKANRGGWVEALQRTYKDLL